jgi:hypothetical protein
MSVTAQIRKENRKRHISKEDCFLWRGSNGIWKVVDHSVFSLSISFRHSNQQLDWEIKNGKKTIFLHLFLFSFQIY